MNTVSRLRTILDDVSRWITLVTGYMLFFSALLICAEVLMRRLYGSSLAGSDELSGYALAAATSGAMAYTLFRKDHIRIDILYRLFGQSIQAGLDITASLLMIFCSSFLAYFAAREFIESFSYQTVSNTPWHTPLWIPQGVWLVGLLLFVAASLIIFIEASLRMMMGDFRKVSEIAGVGTETDGE